MDKKTFTINTLNRELFILIILLGVFLSALVAGRFDIQEIYKIIIILILLPAILFLSITISKRTSIWQIHSNELTLEFATRKISYPLDSLKKISIGVRSGGRLITLHSRLNNKPIRYWSNKLFQSQDDIEQLIEEFKNHDIPVIVV